MNALELLAEQAVARTEGHVIPTTPQQGQQSDRHQYGQPIPEHWSDDWWNQQDHDNQSFNINTLHHPTVPVAQKENDQTVAELPKIDEERKKTTTGSKSGSANRRDGGDSDVEIEMLSPEDMRAAVLKDAGDEKKSGVSEEDKVLLVEYLTHPEQWKNFKLRQGALMINAASDIFKTKYTATQL
ncbi:hypothetical protein EV368DRAFT_85086 [Lentinula lateritia]|nr:hypothetical protein EV368DRAFT_85086 [Lentinula lateritia]